MKFKKFIMNYEFLNCEFMQFMKAENGDNVKKIE